MSTAHPEWDFELISDQNGLARVAPLLVEEPVLSLDTETWGWQTGNEKLCLVQIGLPRARRVILIDALAISSWEPLEPILQAPTPMLVAHNAQFEEKQFARFGIKLRGVVDTLAQARTLRPDLPNHTLQTVCRYVLDLHLDKEQQTSDWSQRPLSDRQLQYARLDAEVAYAVYAAFAAMEAELTIDAQSGVESMMQDLSTTVTRRMELMKPIATQFALLAAREQMLREAIRARLVEGAPAYEGPYGAAKVSKVKQTKIDPIQLRKVMPEVADLAIVESVERQRLTALMKEHGIDSDLLDAVTLITGYTDRLFIRIGEGE